MKTNLVRSHLGKTPKERIKIRRRRLLDTAFELLSSDGWKHVTIDNLCRKAKLNKRYFYESFSNFDEIVAAVVDEIASGLIKISFEAILKAQEAGMSTYELARTVIDRGVRYLTDEPRRARVLFTEISDSPKAVAHRKATIQNLAKALSVYGHVYHEADNTYAIAELTSALLIGGTIESILTWLDGNIHMSREQFIDDLAALCVIIGDGAVNRERERHLNRKITAKNQMITEKK